MIQSIFYKMIVFYLNSTNIFNILYYFIREYKMFSAAGALQKLGVTLPISETREQKTGFWNLFSRFQLRDT